MLMFATFVGLFILIVFSSLVIIPIASILIGVYQGLTSKVNSDNEFTDFVKSARWVDGK